MSKLISPLLSLILLLSSCTIKPVPISYGSDQCHYCKMIIADARFGSELVSTKGKVFKFDAVECLLNQIEEDAAEEYAYVLSTAFDSPGDLRLVDDLWFLQTDRRPSPMGAGLSAYTERLQAVDLAGELEGRLLSWSELLSGDYTAVR